MTNRRALTYTLVTLVLGAAILWPERAPAQTNDNPQILFLFLKLRPDRSPQLVNSLTRPGTLKPPANVQSSDGIHYELLDADGNSLWHAIAPDPRRRVLEHTDRARSREPKQIQVEFSEAEFMVRLPVRTNAVRVEFYCLSQGTNTHFPRKIRLGDIALPSK